MFLFKDKVKPITRRFLTVVKSFHCQLVSGEFRKVYNKIGPCLQISGSASSQNVLLGLLASVW